MQEGFLQAVDTGTVCPLFDFSTVTLAVGAKIPEVSPAEHGQKRLTSMVPYMIV